jgi:N-acetylglutamate synthase-like GNAT family acetyltransferase
MQLHTVHKLDDAQVLQLMDLYRHAWWAKERTLDDVREMLRHTDLVFGFVAAETNELVAFARVLSDWVYFAIVFDVVVAPVHRRKGIGTHVVETIKSHPAVTQVENIELCCLDETKPFYRQCGFSEATGRMRIKREKSIQTEQKGA